jgi:hypothetical protein
MLDPIALQSEVPLGEVTLSANVFSDPSSGEVNELQGNLVGDVAGTAPRASLQGQYASSSFTGNGLVGQIPEPASISLISLGLFSLWQVNKKTLRR